MANSKNFTYKILVLILLLSKLGLSEESRLVFSPKNDLYLQSSDDQTPPALLASGKEALCSALEKHAPPWTCSCGQWKSQFNLKETCLQDRIDLRDLDCDGLTNDMDPYPFIPYNESWTMAIPDFWRRYRVRYDSASKQYVVNLRAWIGFPENISEETADILTRNWISAAESHYSTQNTRFEFNLIHNKSFQDTSSLFGKYAIRLFSSDYFDSLIRISDGQQRCWALGWSLRYAAITHPPYTAVLHELGHLLGLNDAYLEPDWQVALLKLFFHHEPDPQDIGDVHSIMSASGDVVGGHHYFRILGAGSCPP